jgi:cytochrome c-type biogenesis protein CcmH
MRLASLLLCALLLAVPSVGLAAAIDSFKFDSPEEEARFRQLSAELRCLVCQNQSIADSNADLAQDLRREVYGMVTAGQGNAEIVDFLVSRYGDFVLYRPPLNPVTVLLWAAPFALIAIGLFFMLRFIRQRVASAPAGEAELSPEERARLAALLDNDAKEPNT